ncbi:MAG: CoA transferase [Actinomycetia bacterium]|nr:CoA transferase [Actinomycetes bacterium]
MSQPLSGLRVIDLSGLPGAYGTRLLAALGAEVIKVERPEGNVVRRLGPFAEGAPEGEGSLWWGFLAMGTRSVVIDVETADGRGRLADLLGSADMVVDDHGPDVLDDAGIGYDTIAADNPGVIWVAVTPFGLTGPKRDWKTSNLIAWAASGALYTVGFQDQAPVTPGGPVQLALHIAALNTTVGTLLGVRARRQTGRGQLIDISIQETTLAVAPEIGVPVFLDDRVHRTRSGNRRTLTRPFGVYPCSDGYISILIILPHHWTAVAQWIHDVTGNESVIDPVFADNAVRGDTMELIDEWFEEMTLQKTGLDLFLEGQGRGIPVTPVNTIADLRSDPHLEAAGFWQETELPAGGTVAIPGAPFRTNADWWLTARAPRLGEHTGQVLGS